MKFFLLAFLMTLGLNAFAAVNKWVDENNRTHYSDQPPPVSAKTIKLRSTSKSINSEGEISETESGESAEPKTIAEREADLRKAQKEKKEANEKSAQKQADDATNKANCANARQSLKGLESGMRIVEIGENGERSYLEDEQRQTRIAKTEQDISRLCQ